MKKHSLKGKDEKELKTLLEEKTTKLEKFKQDLHASRTKNVKEGREIRKDIARVLTSLNNKDHVNAQ